MTLPGILLEYFYTNERVTKDTVNKPGDINSSFLNQLSCCLKSKLWVIIMVVTFHYQISINFQSISLLYYCNWVLGKYNDGITMTLVNAVGQFPLGIGIIFLMSLAKKYSKRMLVLTGGAILIIGSIICLSSPRNLIVVLIGLFVRSLGQLPMYLIPAIMADSLDHVETVNKSRYDGFSSSINNLLMIAGSGISIGIFNICLTLFGYMVPDNNVNQMIQNENIQKLFTFGFFGVPLIAMIFILLAMIKYKTD
jgi:GPH family glycoside/pentoside/hexuronide:cation symporter